MDQILSVKNDFVFKKIFGEKGCETVLASFLECVLDISIDYIEIRGDKELVGAYLGDKTSIIDVYAIIMMALN